jgi:hypothetical protein
MEKGGRSPTKQTKPITIPRMYREQKRTRSTNRTSRYKTEIKVKHVESYLDYFKYEPEKGNPTPEGIIGDKTKPNN